MTELFFRVLTLSLTCGAVVGLALLLLPKLKQRYAAKTAYFLWLVLALRLITPFEFTLPQETPVTVPVHGNMINMPVVALDPVRVETFSPNVNMWMASEHTYMISPTGPEGEREEEIEVLNRPSQISAGRLAARLWLLGCIAVLLWQAGGYLLARRTLMKWAEPAGEEELALLKQLAGEKHPALYRAPVDTPMMLGLLRPVLLLPLEPLDGEELTIALCHELAHWRRNDVAYKTLMAAACVLHWFNPLVWLMAKQAGQTVEICCDDAVTAGQGEEFRQVYGRALIHTAAVERAIPFTTCFGGGKEQMKERLQNLFVKKKNGPVAVCLFLCAALLLGNLVSCGGQTVPTEPTPTETLSEAFHGLVASVGEESISILPVNWDETEGTLLISAGANALPVEYPVDVENVTVQAYSLKRDEGLQHRGYVEFRDLISMRQMLSSTLRFHPVTGERLATTGSVFLFTLEEDGITSIIETGEHLDLSGMEVAHPVTYTNDTCGFSLSLPGYWEGRYAVIENCDQNDELTKLAFFTQNQPLLYIIRADREGSSAELPEKITEGEEITAPVTYLGTGEGKAFFLLHSSAPAEFGGNTEALAQYENMKQGVPYIGPEDFYFYGTGASLQGNTFVNLTYDFSIDLPKSWDGHVSVQMNGDEHAQFYYDDGNTMLYLMDISVHEETLPENGRTVLLGQGKGVWVYGYLGMTDLPAEAELDEADRKLFRTMLEDREFVWNSGNMKFSSQTE